jgi:hypothetical protein
MSNDDAILLTVCASSHEPEILSPLALLLFTAARRPARTGEDGEPVLLAGQDRSRWDHVMIGEASVSRSGRVTSSPPVGGELLPGPYQRLAMVASATPKARAIAGSLTEAQRGMLAEPATCSGPSSGRPARRRRVSPVSSRFSPDDRDQLADRVRAAGRVRPGVTELWQHRRDRMQAAVSRS